MRPGTLITNIGDLVTLAPVAAARKLTGFADADLGRLRDAWLVIQQGRVRDFGTGTPPDKEAFATVIDAQGGLVLPGLVDCHTHPIFAGSRSSEFCQRLAGATYQDIARAGGGIKSTVRATRAATDDELVRLTAKRLARFLRHGVTTVEAKSGYGLSVEEELRLLRGLAKASAATPQTVAVTCLALHAVPAEFESTAAYVRAMTDELLPRVAAEGLATWVDAFVEEGYFTVAASEPYIARAKELGFKIRIHADEFVDSGSGLAAARWGARSADHLECASAEAIRAMAQANVVAVLLPGTSLYTKLPYTSAKPFRDAGCPVALATDFNPGSCQVDNLPFIATIGALHCGLTLPEALAAVTYVPAFSLELERAKGALARGHDADLLLFDELATAEEWLADLGRHPPRRILIRGEDVTPGRAGDVLSELRGM